MLATWRLYAYLAVVLVIAGLLWHDKWLADKLKAKAQLVTDLTSERDQARADYQAFKQAAATDAALNRKTREVLQARLTDIERTRAAVSVRCYAANVPSAHSQGRTTPGADAAAVNHGPAETLRDIGSALEDARIEALKNNNNYERLQDWERARR